MFIVVFSSERDLRLLFLWPDSKMRGFFWGSVKILSFFLSSWNNRWLLILFVYSGEEDPEGS